MYPVPVPVGAAAFFGFPAVMPIDPHRGRGNGGRSRSRSRSRDRDNSRRERLHANGSRGTTTQQQAENRRTGGDSARTAQTIFVTGIHPKIDDMDLFEFFSHAGRVDDIQLIKDGRTGKSKGLAYVEFSNVEEAKKGTLLNGQLVGGYPINIVLCQATASVQNKHGAPPQVSGDSVRLYVGSLHYFITEKDLEPIFEAFGALESVEIHRDPQTGVSKGFGFVQFKHKADGETAMAALDGYDIAGRNIRVGYASTADAANAKIRAQFLPTMQPASSASTVAPTVAAAAASTAPPPPLSASQLVPSRCVLISNMFDPALETEPDWNLDLEEDVRDEVTKFGALTHIRVDATSKEGHVYLRFADVAAAQKNQSVLHGRWFTNRQLTAEFVAEDKYAQQFPEADNAAATANAAPAAAASAAAASAEAAAESKEASA